MRVPFLTFHQARGDYVDRDGMHYGIAIHATANTASDTAEAGYADHRTDGVSAHFYCDRDSVTQALDTDRRAGHAGSAYGNDHAIAFELTGLTSWSRSTWLASIAWEELGRVVAYLLTHDPDLTGFQVRRASVAEMRANPRVKALYGHNDMRSAWGGTDHTDPGPGFPWDRLISAINDALGGDDDMLTSEEKGLLQNAERFTTALATLQDPIPVPAPWGDPKNPVRSVPNPIVALRKRIDALSVPAPAPVDTDELRRIIREELAALAGRLGLVVRPDSV